MERNIKLQFYFTIILLWSSCVRCEQNEIAGTIEIQIDLVNNIKRMLKNSTCCDGSDPINSSEFGPYRQCPLSTKCYTYFVFCVSTGWTNNCNFGRLETPVLGINSFKMPVNTTFDTVKQIRENLRSGNRDVTSSYKFPIYYRNNGLIGRAKFQNIFTTRVEAWHRDPHTNQSGLIADGTIYQDSFTPHGVWRYREIRNANSFVAYHIKVGCEYGWFQETCQKWCIERGGRYRYFCDPLGNRHCYPGYYGDLCAHAICARFKCNETNGFCASPGTCHCDAGWQLPTCDFCQRKYGCVHGYCVHPFECRCHKGWTGELCNIETNPCRHEPCRHGQCENNNTIPGGILCHCDTGYTGQYCDEEITLCFSNPCGANGKCSVVNKTGFTCVCAEGFTGTFCDININDCVFNNTCQNNGTCIDKVIGHECECVGGWDGVDCTQDKNECLSNPCINSDGCVNLFNDYLCWCKRGWLGKNCEINANECKGQCQNNGTCVDLINGYTCLCSPGYTGTNCEIDINDCLPSPCDNNGVCVDLVDDFKCYCQTGFFGNNCEKHVNKCFTNPCLHVGNCTQLFNDYHCSCLSEWTGKYCEEIRTQDSCKSINFCRFDSKCVFRDGVEICICESGYTGKYCELDFDDCYNVHCQNFGTCLDGVNSYQCICKSGFTGLHCEHNVDECLLNPCNNNGICMDGINSFTCLCPPGFKGYDCSYNINDCENVACLNGGTCVDMVDGYMCKCQSAFSGKNCENKLDACLSSPCGLNGNCSSLPDGYQCNCYAGFTGKTCFQELDVCVANLCGENGFCEKTKNTYKCVCKVGYQGNFCENLDLCSTFPCLNGSTCITSQNDYQCVCQKGFFGHHCDKVENSCLVIDYSNSSFPILIPSGVCSNYSTCIPLADGNFTCDCHKGWTGERCEIGIDKCMNNACQNGASCTIVHNGYNCICPSGFTGKYCQTNINDCTNVTCSNNGTCFDLINDFMCDCKNGWKGKVCSSKSSNCDPPPCNNGGRCTDLGNKFLCKCVDGFKGSTCGELVSMCHDDICLNGGTCVALNSFSVKCQCRQGFYGDHCEKNPDNCVGSPCFNGGRCVDGPDWYHCKCPQGFRGKNCEIELNECRFNPCPSYMKCVNLVKKHLCVCPFGKTGKFCHEDSNKLPCLSSQQYIYHHNDTWTEDCNTCNCENGVVKCTKVWCGPINCYDTRRYTNCSCSTKSDVDCITPPCSPWGKCNFITAGITDTLCLPTHDNSEITANCAKVHVAFQKVLLPPGVMTEKLCEEFRYLDCLKYHGQTDEIHLECKRESTESSVNKIIIAVHQLSTASQVALKLAQCFQFLQNTENDLYKLRQSLVNVTVYSNPTILATNQASTVVWVFTSIAVSIGVLLVVLLIVVIWCYRKRIKRNNDVLHGDIFFRKQTNVLATSLASKTMLTYNTCQKKMNSAEHVKQFNEKDKCLNTERNDIEVTDNVTLDKLFISEPSASTEMRTSRKNLNILGNEMDV